MNKYTQRLEKIEVVLNKNLPELFDKALKEVCKSVQEDALSLTELRNWNEKYGDSGSHEKVTLSYFL